MRSIPLTQGLKAIVDDGDYELVSQYPWHAARRNRVIYAAYRPRRGCILMHRLILNAMKGMDVDHINHDGLDNRRSNLRLCTRSENLRNQRALRSSTGLKGIHLDKRGRWTAYIKPNAQKSHKFLGYFDNAIDAAVAYDAAARQHYGEFARTNFHH